MIGTHVLWTIRDRCRVIIHSEYIVFCEGTVTNCTCSKEKRLADTAAWNSNK